jgi:hypothetical protein
VAASGRIGSRGTQDGEPSGPAAAEKVPGWHVWFPRFFAAVALGLIVAEMIHNDGGADSTTLVLLALAMILIVASLAPRPTSDALRRVTSFKLGGLELGLGEIKLAEHLKSPPKEHDRVGVGGRPDGTDYSEIVGRLELCVDRTKKMLDLGPDLHGPREVVAELRSLKLLDQYEETFVLELLRGNPISASWPSGAREGFLDAAWSFAVRFRAMIWDRHVRRRLAEAGWFVAKYDQATGHRPDFLIYRESRWALVAARPGSVPPNDPDPFEKAVPRLSTWEPIPIQARCIVMPDKSRGKLPSSVQSGVPHVVILCDLAEITASDGWPAIFDLGPDDDGRSQTPPPPEPTPAPTP